MRRFWRVLDLAQHAAPVVTTPASPNSAPQAQRGARNGGGLQQGPQAVPHIAAMRALLTLVILVAGVGLIRGRRADKNRRGHSHIAAEKAVADVLARAAAGATIEESIAAMRSVADEREVDGTPETQAVISGAIADVLRGYASVTRDDNGRRRQLEHQACDNYIRAADLLLQASDSAGSRDKKIQQTRRHQQVSRHLEDASDMAYDLSGGSTDELAFAIAVQAKQCDHMHTHQGPARTDGIQALAHCYLRLAQYKHFIGNHQDAIEFLAKAEEELGDPAADTTPEHMMVWQLTASSLHHLGRYDEAIATVDAALQHLTTATAATTMPEIMKNRAGLESRGGNTLEVALRRARADALLAAGRVREAREAFKAGAAQGMWRTEWQRPGVEYGGLSAPLQSQPFWDSHGPEFTELVGLLENKWEQIRDEGLAVFRDGGFDNLSGQTKRNGTSGYVSVSTAHYTNAEWHHLILYEHGFKHFKHCALTPITCRVVESLGGGSAARNVHGHIKFSLVTPGIAVSPHCGPSNIRIRMHLGLDVPAGCTLTVGNVSGGWQEGRVTIMDDSFEHSIAMDSNAQRPRLVLLVDALHPGLTAAEVGAMKPPQMGERVIAANLDAYGSIARAFGIGQNWTTQESDRMHAVSV
jgi:tetratricopeptide (TPR) repeat protein